MKADTTRQKFETWTGKTGYLSLQRTEDGHYQGLDTQTAWWAYQQGQRDLINSMHVVGYRYYVDKMDYWELVEDPVVHRICYPVYFLPEDTPK